MKYDYSHKISQRSIYFAVFSSYKVSQNRFSELDILIENSLKFTLPSGVLCPEDGTRRAQTFAGVA